MKYYQYVRTTRQAQKQFAEMAIQAILKRISRNGGKLTIQASVNNQKITYFIPVY